ncbi:exocyst complex component 1 [Callorhinchus milii]|uniref:Exocyst complex component 1-like n=1 Tax=Callorhinchus milii TaxID=7868 RepID=A0A4W3H2S4_CALMI|nr:exocyst complex component 1 [Callorhinchus milii]|eukprot:gi/632935355/ref/XP_007889731.1/ PREDICTED: exocyst complex component 1-like isoform X2 [Callorhinchus milii]
MIAIRNQLQKDVFTPQEERLLGLLFVWKAGKKRKNCILCAAVSTDRPYQTSLVKFKKADKGSVYKQVTWWSFEDLLLVDGKNPNKEAPEFDLQFDKVYRWIASSSGEKNAFMSCLLKLNRRYLHNRIKFVNISAHILEESHRPQVEQRVCEPIEEEEEEEEVGVYQELTPKEAIDIEKLIEQFDQSISNAEAFAEKMTKDLHVLDEENIRSIIVSEKQVTEMMELIDMGLVEVNHIENTLQTYEELLQSVKEQMDHIHQSNYLLQVIDSNQQKLLEQVTFLVHMLNIAEEHQHALRNGDLSKPAGVQACIAAVEALNNCMNVKLLPGHRKMQSVAEQLIKCESLRQHFESRFIRHINNMFVLQGADQNITLTQESGDLILPNHRFYHEELLPYTPLMAWLKTSNPAIFTDLSKVYTDNIRKLYERQIKEFFDLVKFKLTGTKEGMRFRIQESFEKLTASTSNLQKSLFRPSFYEHLGSEADFADRGMMDRVRDGQDGEWSISTSCMQITDQVLAELEPMCIAEEEFITKFFMMNEDRSSETVQQEILGSRSDTLIVVNEDSSERIRICRSVAEQEDPALHSTRKMMSEIFSTLEADLKGFVNLCDKINPSNSLHLLVTVSQRALTVQDGGPCSFLKSTLGNILVQVKRNFDKCIYAFCKQIEEAKVPKKIRVVILPFVVEFDEFLNVAESIFKNTDRRGNLDKAYNKVIAAVFASVKNIASMNLKKPPDVVIMENFHHIFCCLSKMKIISLEDKKKEAYQQYTEHCNLYVTKYLGQPLEKLNNFFDGVKARISQGVKEDEVSYQLAFSKQELRKVIEKYQGKEVKKALENLYKKVTKHLSEEENLLQVVWRTMQGEFVRQYKEFEDMIARCYPGSGITMNFTVEDILQYFSDITKSN